MIYTVQINYKSGISCTFDVKSFEINGGTYSWEAANANKLPINIGVEDIESVWMVGVKEA